MGDPEKLSFIANARLKDIVGRGLINSDDLAIIELIKNSKDAGSANVSVDFYQSEEIEDGSELYILDEGTGMSAEDIKYKWLNIAYSEKKNAAPARGGAYAGNKGIGRFSCDRLGAELTIYTRKKSGRFISLEVDWKKYEINDREIEIGHIPALFRYITPKEFEAETGLEQFNHGTLLVIRRLRSNWDLKQLKSLRRELERFSIDPEKIFSVSLSHWRYDEGHLINKPIENKIFDELDFRTTSILAEIDAKGKYVTIELRHDGDYVFKAKEQNPYRELSDVKISLYFLNQPAKAFFKRRTGYSSVNYGSAFLFLNGFRVFPYGSEGNDWLGIDRRHGQGHQRTFATRDLVGFIEIKDNDDRFVPVSSREGLVHNAAYSQLTSLTQTIESKLNEEQKLYGFFHKVARKLEKFVVDGLDWDRIDRALGEVSEKELLDGDFNYLTNDNKILESIDSIVKIRSAEEYIESVDINVKYLSKLADQESEEYEELVEALKEKFDGTPIEKLKPSEKKNLSKFISRQAKALASKDQTNRELERKSEKIEKELKVERKRRLFSDFESTADQERIIRLHHQISLIAGSLVKRLNRTARDFRKNPDAISKEALFSNIEAGMYELERIQNVAKMASKADFNIKTNRVKVDLVQFIEEYIRNFPDIAYSWGIKVKFVNDNKVSLERWFRPIEITVLVDNLIDNAGKANASKMSVEISRTGKKISIDFADNGKGLPDDIAPEALFEKGITTTIGSGIGLSHVRSIIHDLKGEVSISPFKNGTRVHIEFPVK